MVWLPPPLCAFPTNHHHCVRCPALSALCVCVGGGTGHSGALWWHARWCGAVLGAWPPHPPPTLSTLVASLLSPAPKPTLTHTQMALLTPHTHGVLCVPRPIHSLTHWLPHCPHTLHTHWWVCVCSSTCSHAPSHTQRRHRRGACLAALVLWSPPPRPLCHTHTHRDWWWAPWWWLVVGVWALCGCHATPPTRLACHHTRHIHHHTHHGVLFVWHALPLPPPPLNPITHTTTATVPQWWLPLVTMPSTHTPHLPHTHATHTKGKHRRGCGFWCGTTTTLVLAIRCLLFFPSCPPTPFSLSLACTHTPLIPSSPTPPSHPSPVCGVCVVGMD